MNELALFAGAGGGILGGILLGWRTVCAVEINAYARRVLLARQRDRSLEPFPIWDDVTTFNGKQWAGVVDVVSGGFPCQDISAAGRGEGITGERSGLWAEFARIIGEVQPAFVWVENSPMLTLRGLGVVCGDLAALGYDARWGVIGASETGAPHRRERIWIMGYPVQGRCTPKSIQQDRTVQRERAKASSGTGIRKFDTILSEWWKVEPNVGRVVDGLAVDVDRIAAIGNGQVPAVVKLAWNILSAK